MFIKAKCKEDNSICILNTDYVVDIIYSKCQWIAYTFDNERSGYILEATDVERLQEEQEQKHESTS